MKQTYSCEISSPIGVITAVSDGSNLTELWTRGAKYHGDEKKEDVRKVALSDVSVFEETHRWLDIYFSGKNPDFMPPLAPQGSQFRQKVWKILCQIPYGETTTYGAIAKRLEKECGWKRAAAQPVGGAVGHNPIGILIPCHRVIGADGSLTGYAGGLDVKKKLLKLEGVLK